MAAETIEQAARSLNVSPSTVRRWIRRGAPVARCGSRGRGRVTLVCPDALAAWRASCGRQDDAAALSAFAGRVPELIAGAIDEAFVSETGPHKRASARLLVTIWYLASAAVMEEAGTDGPDVLPGALPESIKRMQKIATK